jgi:hypothetical protein
LGAVLQQVYFADGHPFNRQSVMHMPSAQCSVLAQAWSQAPTPVLAGQGHRAFDVAAPTTTTVGEPTDTVITAPPSYRAIVASATAVVPHSAHLELLATGEPGRQFSLSWEETCRTQEGNIAGQGIETQLSPAVTMVKLPRANGGGSSCYLAATASTTTLTRRVRLAIIDY